MARRQSQSVPAVSLFPFLAVLVCAMGSLILLLLVISRHVRPPAPSLPTLAEAEPDEIYADPLPQFPALPELSDLIARHVTVAIEDEPRPDYPPAPSFVASQHARPEILAMQQSQSEEIASQQAKLQRLTSQLQQLTADLQQLKQQRESRLAELKQMQVAQGEMQAQAGKTQQSIQDLRDQIAAIESEVADKKMEAANLQAEKSDREDKLEIVAYDGPTGAKRQPIFVECRGGEVVFHPEKIALSTMDLEKIPPQYSPIAYAVQALAEHRRRTQPDYQAYVLMVGRPNGIEEFYGCGQALTGHRIPFGYELIGQDRELYLGQPDPVASQIILDAIDRARRDARSEPNRFQKMHTLAERAKLRGYGGPEATGRSGGSGVSGGVPRLMEQLTETGAGGPPAGRFPVADTPSGGGAPEQFPSPERTASLGNPGGEKVSRSGAAGETESNKWTRVDSNANRQPPAGATSTNSGGQRSQATAAADSASQWSQTESPPQFTEVDPLEALKSGSGSSRSHGPSGPGGIGMAGPGNGAIRLERTVRIQVFADGVQVSKLDFVGVPEGVQAQALRGVVLDRLREEIRNWGAAPDGIEWQPRIRLEVAPGGNRLAFRMEDWMDEFGLQTESVPVVAKSPASETRFFE